MPSIQTDRLLLRLPEAGDLDALIEIHEHPEVVRFLSGNRTAGRQGAWRTLAIYSGHWNLRGYGPWVVVERASGSVIGRVGLWNPEGWPGIEIGWVVRHDRWRRGFATEAAQAALEWAWRHVSTDEIISIIEPDNARSIRVAEKLGERFARMSILDGKDVAIYGVHRP